MPKANIVTQEAFAQRLEEATRTAQISVEKREGLLLFVRINGESQRLNLEMAWRAYENAPTRLEEIVAAHLTVVQGLNQVRPAINSAQVDHVLPVIQRTDWLTKTTADGATPVYRPLVTGLIVAYVFDLPAHRAYINTSMLTSQLGQISPAELHEHALDNLRQQTPNQPVLFHGVGKQQLIVCETRDGYATSLLLLPELMQQWADRLVGSMLLGLPNRDFLIAFSEKHPDLATLTRQIKTDARSRMRALSPYLLVWKEGKLREQQPLH